MKHRWLGFKRRRLHGRGFASPMNELLESLVPARADSFADIEFVSLDIETTGLDATVADMLSVGWVVIRNGIVDLSTAASYIVRPSSGVGDSASVHGLTDTIVEAGYDWPVVLNKIIETLSGRVLVVHHAGLDKALLDRMCRERFGCPLPVPVVDTLALEHRRQKRRDHADSGRSLKLSDLRDAYQLPRYNAHDSLVDAIATAELLVAMVATNLRRDAATLADLL